MGGFKKTNYVWAFGQNEGGVATGLTGKPIEPLLPKPALNQKCEKLYNVHKPRFGYLNMSIYLFF